MRDLNNFETRVTLLWFFLFYALVLLCVLLCDHHLIYSLDDAFIHLDVARNILHGTYGINAGEPSSPSSSIIWPWLLAATQLLGLGVTGPLVLNALAAGATVYVSARLIRTLGLADNATGAGMTLGIGLLVIFAANALALPMTGMEHTWHVLTVALVIEGLIAASKGTPPNTTFIIALVAMPLFRFEGMALFLVSVAALWLQGYRRAAVTAAVAGFSCLAAYEAFLFHLGLPPLPSSVLLKLDVANDPHGKKGFLQMILYNLKASFGSSPGQIYWCFLAYLGFMMFFQRRNPRLKYVYLPIICSIMAQMICERFPGIMNRYTIYIMEMAFLGICFSLSDMTGWSIKERRFLLFLLGAVPAYTSALTTIYTPAGVHSIYGQQYQMHRFVNDYYHGPVGVNDLGLVGYKNSHYVLDLWGLGSMDVYRLRRAHAYNAAAIDGLVKKHDVRLVMIFKGWFLHMTPRDWKTVGKLHDIDDAYNNTDVTFYAPPGADRSRIIHALRKFEPTLPAGTTFIEDAAYFKGG